MYLINQKKVESGDIILTRSESRESVLIRQMTKSDYSHAILYVGVSSCIESDGLGVQSQNLQRLLFKNPEDAIVLRLKDQNLKSLLPGAIVFARQKIGTEYSTSEAKLARINKNIAAKEQNRQFCTRFVAQAYTEAGINIVNNPDYCSPQDIMASSLLVQVEDVWRTANNLEVEFVNDEKNPLARQADIHNSIFESARNKTGQDIQTFDQLSKYVLENPSKDLEMSDLLEKSGYLEMWKMDTEANPWHYNYELFVRHYQNPLQRKEVGYFFATTEKQTRERFIITLDAMNFCYSLRGQKYFKILINLYETLINLSKQREQVGIKALKE